MANVDQTIANMMEVLNPKNRRRTELVKTPLDFESPLKRRLSSDSSTDSPDKRPKQDNYLDVSWISSPREARRIRTDLIEARNHVTELEHRIQRMHSVRKEIETVLDSEIKSLNFQHEQDTSKIDQLEKQMQSIRKRERETFQEFKELQQVFTESNSNYEKRILDLEMMVTDLQNQLEVYEHAENEQIGLVQTDNNKLSEALEKAESEMNLYKDLVADLQSRLGRYTSITNDLEIKEQQLQTANLKIKELEYTLESHGEWQIQCKMQQQKLAKYPDLERENLKLREEIRSLKELLQNKLILEEQVHDLNIRLEQYRARDKTAASQITNAQLELAINEWQAMAREVVETQCTNSALPRQLKQAIDRLQQQEVTLTSEKIDLESQLKSAQQDLKMLRAEREKNQKLNSDLQTIHQQHQTLLHRLQKKLQLVSRERDSYRAQLDSYEKDLTSYIAPVGQGTNAQLNVQKERIDSLMEIIEGYREMMANLESQLRDAQPHLNSDNIVPVRMEQITRLQSQVDKLQAENQRLTERCDELQVKLEEQLVGKDVVHGKVVHLKMNPLSECIAENEAVVQKLREDNDRLKRKIRSLEEGFETTKLSDSICTSREYQSLKEQHKSLEVKMQRLKEYFKSSSNEFREVCYMLLGYKIDRVNSKLYRLSSMYAERPQDHLEFQLNSDGALQMMETEFSATLDELIDLHLRQHNSIPAFLSTLTMDLFGRTTVLAATLTD